MKRVPNLGPEHFESYSRVSNCVHSSVYPVFWPRDRVVDCIHIDLNFWVLKMICSQVSNFVNINGLIVCILFKASINS